MAICIATDCVVLFYIAAAEAPLRVDFTRVVAGFRLCAAKSFVSQREWRALLFVNEDAE